MNMKAITIMYIKMYKAIDSDTEESCDLVQYMTNVIKDNLKDYGINQYDGSGSPTDELEYYISTLSKKYLNVDIFDTIYWQYNIYIPHDNLKEKIELRETMQSLKSKSEVTKFLDWYKEIQSGIVCQFDYEIIDKNEISNIIQNSNCEEFLIDIQDLDYNFYNPIICWVDTSDITTLFIKDWINLRSQIIHENWIDYPEQIESFMKEFKQDYKIKKCIKLLNEINDSVWITQEIMDKISEVFLGGEDLFDDGAFSLNPILIEKISDLKKVLKEYCDDPVLSALYFAEFIRKYRNHINLYKDQYWFYRDGTNWELYIEDHASMIGYLEDSIEFGGLKENKDFDKLIEVLEEIKGDN